MGEEKEEKVDKWPMKVHGMSPHYSIYWPSAVVEGPVRVLGSTMGEPGALMVLEPVSEGHLTVGRNFNDLQ